MISQKTQELINRMMRGDKSALAHLLSIIERESPEIPEIMKLVSPSLIKAYHIGITGLTGAGKSTLIDKLTDLYRKQGFCVGILAIDPSSRLSGGAVLGDRIRMQKHFLDDGVFIRSMATRGCQGGLCKSIDNAVKLMDAAGKQIIFIETTGVGQTETDITRIADVVVTVLAPGFGDGIQLMKAGLIEIGDIIIINKADREGAEILAEGIRDELSYSNRKNKPSLLLIQAANNIGIEELFKDIEERKKGKV
jgi:LAO/AO transport system kinase